MLSKSDRREACKRIYELRKNPPKITQQDKNEAARIFQKNKDFEKQKDKDIRSEIKDFSKDLSGYVYNQINGVGYKFHGIGEGTAKKTICAFQGCGKHESEMFNVADGHWYCGNHKWFGLLTKEQKEKELKNVKEQDKFSKEVSV